MAWGLHAALALAIELAALWGFGAAAWGVVRVADGGAVPATLAAVLAVAAGVGLWALWGAPRSSRRLAGGALLAFKAAFFLVAALAWALAHGAASGLAFAAVAAVHLILLKVLGEMVA